MTKNLLKPDERNIEIIHRVLSLAQTVTTVLLIAMLVRRLHILGQPFDENWDIGSLVLLNGAFLITGILYLGGINWPKISLKGIAAVYVTFTLAVLLFKLVMDVVIQGRAFSIPGLLSREMLVVAVICAVITALFATVAYLGQRRIEKEFEE